MYNEQGSTIVLLVLRGVVTEQSKPCGGTVRVFVNRWLDIHAEQLLRTLVLLHRPDFELSAELAFSIIIAPCYCHYLSPYKFVLLAVPYYNIANTHPIFAILLLLILYFVLEGMLFYLYLFLRGMLLLLFCYFLIFRSHAILLLYLFYYFLSFQEPCYFAIINCYYAIFILEVYYFAISIKFSKIATIAFNLNPKPTP